MQSSSRANLHHFILAFKANDFLKTLETLFMWKPILRRVAIVLVTLLVIIQLVPYGRNQANPSSRVEPQWDSAATRALAKRACFDCHSNETEWPWYSQVAPISWLVQNDVNEGRRKMNFSEWDRPQKEADEAAEQIQKGEMPLWFYLPLHPPARLSSSEKQALIRGLQATIGGKERSDSEETDESSGTDEDEH
jgi:mono/diheme cytochrome c family protein